MGLGVGVTKPISSIPLFSQFSLIVKTMVTYWISPYLAGVTAAELQWHLSNMNVIKKSKRFARSNHLAYGAINEWSFSNPHPWFWSSLCLASNNSISSHSDNKISLIFFQAWLSMIFGYKWSLLTLNVQGPSYLGLTRSISWLLMPWLITSPGHQLPWYWLCRIGRFLS